MGDIRTGCSLVVTIVRVSIVLLLAIFCTPQKASVGMYSRCDYRLSLVCVLFDPAIPTSFFNFIQLFLYLFLFFF